MTITQEHQRATSANPRYGLVFFTALAAGTALGASAMFFGPDLLGVPPANEMDQLAAEFGLTIEWTDSTHPESPGPGSFAPETPDVIYVSAEMDEGATLHTVLHEAGHAMQHRAGAPLDECAAEEFARALGSTYWAYEECR